MCRGRYAAIRPEMRRFRRSTVGSMRLPPLMVFVIEMSRSAWTGKSNGNGMRGGLNLSLTKRHLHFDPTDESPKLGSIHRGFAKEYGINIPETRRIDSSYGAVQVLARSSVFEARERTRSLDCGDKPR
jgi:hypothetical protein